METNYLTIITTMTTITIMLINNGNNYNNITISVMIIIIMAFWKLRCYYYTRRATCLTLHYRTVPACVLHIHESSTLHPR